MFSLYLTLRCAGDTYLPFDCDSFEGNAAAICDAIYDIEKWLQLQDLQRYKELHTEKKVFSA